MLKLMVMVLSLEGREKGQNLLERKECAGMPVNQIVFRLCV